MNPVILSPTSRFDAPKHQAGGRSPSISPDRWQYSARNGLDPLLSNLSPTSTLQALEAADAPASTHDALQDSLAAVSASDRSFGIQAALAGKKLKEWYRELSSWPWPEASLSHRNGFRPLATKEHGRGRLNPDHAGHGDGFAPAANAEELGDFDDGEYCGSVPKMLARKYEERIEAIQRDMDALGVEDLKEFVRDAHTNPNSRPQRRRISGQGILAFGYNHLDEFTAVVTATIMHALPTISRLNSLLSVWSTRLAVLHQVPGFLRLLKETQVDMETGISVHKKAEFGGNGEDLESMEALFTLKRATLEGKIFDLGRRLDTMLDLLECKEDTVPTEWIDEMETLESEFSAWVVEFERSLMEQSLKIYQRESENTESRPEELKNVERGSLELNHNGHAMLLQDDGIYAESGEDSIGPQQSLERRPSILTHAACLEFDRPIDQTQDENSDLSTSIPESSMSSAEVLSTNTFLNNDLNRSSATGNYSLQRSQSQLESPTESGPSEQVIEEETGLRRADSEVDHSHFEGPVLHDYLADEERSKDASQEGDAYTPSSHDTSEETHDDTDLPVSAGSRFNRFGRSEPHEEVFTDEPMQLFRDNTKKVESSAPQTTRSFSIPPCPTPIDDLEAQLSDASINQSITTPRPAPLIIRPTPTKYDGNASSEISPDTSHPGSGTSEYFSNMSSPEIHHASVAEYFENPVEVTTSFKSPSPPLAALSRQSSQRTERGESQTDDNGITSPPVRPSDHTRRASSFAPDSTILESVGPGDGPRVRPAYLNSHSRVRSASLRSFEKIPRNEVRNITISRKRDSFPDPDPHFQNGEIPLPPQPPFLDSAASKDLLGDISNWPIPPTEITALPDSVNNSPAPSEIAERVVPAQRPPGGGSARSQHRFENYSDLSPGSTPAKVRQRKSAGRPGIFSRSKNAPNDHSGSPLQNSEDQLEARISSILTEFPGQIRLKSGPESDAPEIITSNSPSGRKRPFLRSSATKLTKTPPGLSSPALTLTPAHSKKSKSRVHDGDSEVKLYHLHQPGRDVPIKLFVRLVGEGGERVMVRIGGGWADLGEYLKEYAIHHGRRSISDGRFEIQGLPQSPSATPSSSQAGFPSSPTSTSSRPNSSSGPLNHVWHPSSKPKRHSFGSVTADSENAPVTPANPPRASRQFEPLTPGSIESGTSSAYLLRPSSRLSSATDDDSPSVGLGLAGPKGRRTAVSPTKQAWVDGMVDQARKASGEKKKPGHRGTGAEQGDFGDLGKVGSTKRVFLKMRRDGVRNGTEAVTGSGSAAGSAAGPGV